VIYKGLKTGVSREQFERSIQEGTVTDLIERVAVHAGECHYIPAGTCHAIGAGLLIAEIQTPSDTTYRVFDWNRLDEQGKSRPLHIDDALNSIRFDQSAGELTVRSEGILVDCDHFRIEKRIGRHFEGISLQRGQLRVLVIVSGYGSIVSPDQPPTGFLPGDTLLIPFTLDATIHFESDCTYLSVSI
jgi:mannose-6-phosphate isomerase